MEMSTGVSLLRTAQSLLTGRTITVVCYIYINIQPQKVKFSSVQINMKQVSQWTLLNLNLTVKEIFYQVVFSKILMFKTNCFLP